MKTALSFQLLLFLGLTTTAFPQGSLTPPGPPAPTMKTLDQVEPRRAINATNTPGDAISVFKITQPGSYYLTGNVTGVSGKHGIYIATGNVTLDLMGFELVGVVGSLDGIHVDNVGTSINYAVRNGTVRQWGENGLLVNIQGKSRIENIRALANGDTGISSANAIEISSCIAFGNGLHGISSVAGTVIDSVGNSNGSAGINAYIVRGCQADGNGTEGIRASNGVVTNCMARGNDAAGILGESGTVITNCTVINNTGNGITLDTGSIAVDCYARLNAIGISATTGSRIAGCTSRESTGAGISTGANCLVQGCVAEANQGQFGIVVGSGSTVQNCVAQGNTSAATSSAGISIGSGSLALACVAGFNTSTAGTLTSSTGQGIVVNAGSTVRDCVARANAGDGIRVSSDCLVEGNTADSNGNGTGADGAGIHVTSADCRIEGNNLTDNDRGLDVDLSQNLIVRNSASGNGDNYVIVAGNAVGAIVVTGASGGISGSGPLASSLGTTDPWANFSY